MARVESNADDVADLIQEVVDGFDFEGPGEEGSLAADLVGLAAQRMIDRGAQGLDPDEADWKPNEPKRYAPYKLRRYDVDRPGELGGQMLGLESMKGRPEIGPDAIEMVYGTGERPPKSARNGVALRPSELRATDREKARYFTASGRRFFAFGVGDREAIVARAGEAFSVYLDALGIR